MNKYKPRTEIVPGIHGKVVRTISRLGNQAQVIVEMDGGPTVTRHVQRDPDGRWLACISQGMGSGGGEYIQLGEVAYKGAK